MNEDKQELLTINYESDKPTVSARELYKGLEVTDRFSRWFERMKAYGFNETNDYTSVKSSTLVNNGAGRELVDYQISVDMAKQICMIQRTEKGRQYRQYFLDLEKAWNTPEQIFARALKMADQTIKKLESENAILIKENKEMLPKAEFHDRVAANDDSITFEEMAKILKSHGIKKIGRNRLFADLRASGVLRKNNIPYQQFMESGWFKVKERVHSSGGKECLYTQTYITPKGQEKIISVYHEELDENGDLKHE